MDDLEYFIGLFVGLNFGVSQEGDDALLKGAKPALDFAFGLERGCDEMSDSQTAQGPLELALRIPVVGA